VQREEIFRMASYRWFLHKAFRSSTRRIDQ
jgi:hypothetical protein